MDTLDLYLDRLASSAPAPGGGSAAALVGALAAALVAMVARISGGNPKYAQYAELAAELVARAEELRVELAQARRRDENAFEEVIAAQALPKRDADEIQARRQALQTALAHAAAEPLRAASLALEVLRLTTRSLEIPNRDLVSDVGCAAEFGNAAILACAYNVRVNHHLMRDRDAVADGEQRLRAIEEEACGLLDRVRSYTTATT